MSWWRRATALIPVEFGVDCSGFGEIWGSTVVAVKGNICWDVTSCSPVEIYPCFRGTHCPSLLSQWITPASSRACSSEAYLRFLLSSFTTVDSWRRPYSTLQSTKASSCAGLRTHILSFKVDNLLGNINLDTPKPINTEMKTRVGIAWRIVVFSAQDSLVSEDLRKLELKVSDMGKCSVCPRKDQLLMLI